jgi:hypothetical protein
MAIATWSSVAGRGSPRGVLDAVGQLGVEAGQQLAAQS